MGWAFYELSGGADFVPASQRGAAVAAVTEPSAADAPEVAARGEADPSRAELKVASVATKSDAPPQADLLPAVAKVTDRPEVKDGNIGEGTLRVLALETPDADEVRAETVAMMSSPAVTSAPDLRVVTGTRVNMRNGPGTRYSVVSRLDQGDEVEVLQDPGDGWVKLRVSESGRIGWMADFLLASVD